MIPVYNFIFSFAGLLFLPFIVFLILFIPKYRGRTLKRLAVRNTSLHQLSKRQADDKQTLWIHALSVGEVTSALPLVRSLQEGLPDTEIVFSAATRSGKDLAEKIIMPHVQIILYSPFDLWWSVNRFIAAIKPDLFILIETDFWPAWLWLLQKKKIPTMLVNGRISAHSLQQYKRFSFFFKPMFSSFSLLSMQTKNDAGKMKKVGVDAAKIFTLGNLKFDTNISLSSSPIILQTDLGITDDQVVWVCGSTHKGEETILFSTFAQLTSQHNMFLVLAPRNIDRADELVTLALQHGLTASRRTGTTQKGNVLILDTIGELAHCYQLADFSFVGGSLVPHGGHNPIEPAAAGVPVVFGPHMDDFSEISQELLDCGGAQTVSAKNITETIEALVSDRELKNNMSVNAKNMVKKHRGCVLKHIKEIHCLLNCKQTP